MNPAKKIVTSLIFLIAFYSSGPIAEDSGFYTVVQYSDVEFREKQRLDEDADLDIDAPAGVLRLGKHISDWIGVEGRIGIGLGTETESFFITGTDRYYEFEIDSIYGICLVVGRTDKSFNPYFVVVYSEVRTTLKRVRIPNIGSEFIDESGLSWGVGASFGDMDRAKLDIEYMLYHDEGDYKFSAISFGVRF